MRKLSAKWVPKCLNAAKKVNGASRLSIFWIFFFTIQMISCRNWWPWTKPGYIPMTRRQSNNQWSGGIAAHPAPENSEFKNPLENLSPRLSGMKTASSSLIILQKAKLSRRSITHRSCTTVSRLTGHLQPRRNWPTWASNVLITYPILRVWPRRTAICSLDWKKKNNWKFAICRPMRRSLLPGRPGWTDNLIFFLMTCIS